MWVLTWWDSGLIWQHSLDCLTGRTADGKLDLGMNVGGGGCEESPFPCSVHLDMNSLERWEGCAALFLWGQSGNREPWLLCSLDWDMKISLANISNCWCSGVLGSSGLKCFFELIEILQVWNSPSSSYRSLQCLSWETSSFMTMLDLSGKRKVLN